MSEPGQGGLAGLGATPKILAIRLARLGDITLLLPALGLLKTAFGGAHLALLTGSPYAPLGGLCPWVDEVIPLDRHRMRDGSWREALGGIGRAVRGVRGGKFDLVVDFHSFRETNLMAWVSGARYRIGMKRADRAYLPFCFNLQPVLEDKNIHVADMFLRVALGIPGVGPVDPVGPSIRVPEVAPRPPELVVAVYVGAFAESRRWPAEKFAQVAAHVVGCWGGVARILSGRTPDEERAAERVASLAGSDPRNSGRVEILRKLGIPGLIAAIASADCLVSNDSGPMHIGSAVGVPTLGIFSESLPRHYRPVGVHDRYVQMEPVADLETAEVLAALDDMRAVLRPVQGRAKR